jgi:putative DNA-invertase from lambdoid prophage Rac
MAGGTPMGKMIFTFLAAIAEFERSLIVERSKAGIARAKAEGVI